MERRTILGIDVGKSPENTLKSKLDALSTLVRG